MAKKLPVDQAEKVFNEDENTNTLTNAEDRTQISTDTLSRKIRQQEAPPVLVVLLGPTALQGKQFALEEGFVIGRSSESKIHIDDRSLSRSHARIDIRNGDAFVVDLGSTNKTVVNGEVLAPMAPCPLKNNDQLKAGNVVFKFLAQGSVEAMVDRILFEKANRDPLTEAYSKGALLEQAPEAMKRAVNLNEPLSVIVLDIDHFKKINDKHLHTGGDYILRELGRIIRSNLVRASDFFARYGGEEFVLILAGASVHLAADIAERIRQTIESAEFIFEGRRITVTVSLGVAERLPEETEWIKLFYRADQALYASKQTGRNRVTIA